MATTVTTTTAGAASATGISQEPSALQMKTELTAALIAAGMSDAKRTDPTPKGFPPGVSWTDAYRMVSRRVEDNNPATPGTLMLSQDLLKQNLAATRTLTALGVKSLSEFPRGTSVVGAIDTLYRTTSNGKLASTFAKSGIYDLSGFPAGTTLFNAYKLIEDPANPGQISLDAYRSYKEATAALKSMEITSLVNFPRGTTMPQAAAMLEPKADQMLAMLRIDKSRFKDPGISSLTAISVLTRLPDTIREMKSLPPGVSSAELARQATAAKKLVTLGYDSLAPFAAMSGYAGKTVTATDAYTLVTQVPPPADLPVPASASSARLFTPTVTPAKTSYGQPNRVTQSVYIPPENQKVKPNPPATTVTVVTAADVIAFNKSFWGTKTP